MELITNSLLEALAAIHWEHEQDVVWSSWHGVPYLDLPEDAKEKQRKYARRDLQVVVTSFLNLQTLEEDKETLGRA